MKHIIHMLLYSIFPQKLQLYFLNIFPFQFPDFSYILQ